MTVPTGDRRIVLTKGIAHAAYRSGAGMRGYPFEGEPAREPGGPWLD